MFSIEFQAVKNKFKPNHALSFLASTVYWASEEIGENPTEIVNTVHFMKVRPYWPNLGNAMMATSYALKLYLERNDFDGATPIMKWIQTQRNGLMRWSSSQVIYSSKLL